MNRPTCPDPPQLINWQLENRLTPLQGDETRVFTVKLSSRGDDDRPELLDEWAVLSEEERDRALRFVRPRDGRRFTLCRAALRNILGDLLDAKPGVVRFRSGPGGKPELETRLDASQLDAQIRFNVTHSEDLALIAVHRAKELGVDLERLRTISESTRIVQSYFTLDEQVCFAAIQEELRAVAFLRGWTRKEAILKAKGVGLAGLATGYETMFGETDLVDRFTKTTPPSQVVGWSLWEASPREGYVAALAIQAD